MSDIRVNIDGKAHDLDDFSLGDLEWLEEYIGRPISDAGALEGMKAAVGFVFIVKRREDPSFTLEQARALKLNVLEGPPEEPAPKRPPKRAAR